jgi:hypothetical protein
MIFNKIINKFYNKSSERLALNLQGKDDIKRKENYLNQEKLKSRKVR